MAVDRGTCHRLCLRHGAYVAPDWTADWLHRECMWFLNYWAKEEYQKPYDALGDEEKSVLQARLKKKCEPIPTTRRPAIW
ncbi:hypothetical protein JCM14720_06540 [Calditerricola yamamurae]